jgi:hypothetical protein
LKAKKIFDFEKRSNAEKRWRCSCKFTSRGIGSRDRCYDFKNIFAKKFSEKIGVLTQNKAKLCKILIVTLVLEKSVNFLPKIVKNRIKL